MIHVYGSTKDGITSCMQRKLQEILWEFIDILKSSYWMLYL